MDLNYVIVRHGHGCHNAIRTLYNHGVIPRELLQSYNSTQFFDPELTGIGVDASIHNGGVISRLLKTRMPDYSIMNVVGCSPLIRCMETAYYMTRKWSNPPSKIYIFPYLREIDEGSKDKYSSESLRVIDTVSSYAMKRVDEQKKYLRTIGILKYFDFSYVEKFYEGRNSPGDIPTFIRWFSSSFVPLLAPVKKLNVFITTHAGVLRDFANEGFVNNSGVLVKTQLGDYQVRYKEIVSFNKMLPRDFFSDYSNMKMIKSGYQCSTFRCSKICEHVEQ
jgi:hypothetical protein